MIVLIYPEQNPKKRWLVQEGKNLFVFSECCRRPISRDPRGGSYDDVCDECNTTLQENYDGWASFVQNISKETGRSGTRQWRDWALHWFGLEDFGISVEMNE